MKIGITGLNRIIDFEKINMVKENQYGKIIFQGMLIAVQPRIRLLRSFDERSHNYLGYALRVNGVIGNEEREFTVGIGKGAQEKHEFRAGDVVSGESLPVQDKSLETVEFYKASKLRFVQRSQEIEEKTPPWMGVPVELETYRRRGHRRLDARTYESKCSSCIWGCKMAVEIIIDHWNRGNKKYRQETFC